MFRRKRNPLSVGDEAGFPPSPWTDGWPWMDGLRPTRYEGSGWIPTSSDLTWTGGAASQLPPSTAGTLQSVGADGWGVPGPGVRRADRIRISRRTRLIQFRAKVGRLLRRRPVASVTSGERPLLSSQQQVCLFDWSWLTGRARRARQRPRALGMAIRVAASSLVRGNGGENESTVGGWLGSKS
jgi:hypothetical protein